MFIQFPTLGSSNNSSHASNLMLSYQPPLQSERSDSSGTVQPRPFPIFYQHSALFISKSEYMNGSADSVAAERQARELFVSLSQRKRWLMA
jgi:hypothetical protein